MSIYSITYKHCQEYKWAVIFNLVLTMTAASFHSFYLKNRKITSLEIILKEAQHTDKEILITNLNQNLHWYICDKNRSSVILI